MGGLHLKCTNTTCNYTALYLYEAEQPVEDHAQCVYERICHSCGTKIALNDLSDPCGVCGTANNNKGEGDTCPECSNGVLQKIS